MSQGAMARPWRSHDENRLDDPLTTARIQSDNVLGYDNQSSSDEVSLLEQQDSSPDYHQVSSSPLRDLVEHMYDLSISDDTLKVSQVTQSVPKNTPLEGSVNDSDCSSIGPHSKHIEHVGSFTAGDFLEDKVGFQIKKLRGVRGRPSILSNTFDEQPAKSFVVTVETNAVRHAAVLTDLSASELNSNAPKDSGPTRALHKAALNFPGAEEQIRRHQAGSYQFIVGVSAAAFPALQGPRYGNKGVQDKDTRYLACNLLSLPKDDTSKKCELLATEVCDLDTLASAFTQQKRKSLTPHKPRSSLGMSSPRIYEDPDTRSPSRLNVLSTPSRDQLSDSMSRMDDSLDAVGRVEEELVAATNGMQLGESRATPSRSGSRLSQRALPRSTTPSTPARGIRPLQGSQGNSTRKPPSAWKNSMENPYGQPVSRKLDASRPVTSLAPPKPLARSSRPPTDSTFILPGELYAKELKERREARAQAAQPAPAPKVYTPRKPTVPDFELPGEAISRRKREQHEAKLKAQEDEIKARREFKARPLRSNIGTASFVRETATSRARASKPEDDKSSIAPASSKRLSMSSLMPARGRASLNGSQEPSQTSRPGSSSNGSVSGKRSSISAEEAAAQKRSNYTISRNSAEEEKRARAEAVKAAREQYSARSRMSSHDWVEKQAQRAQAAAAQRASQT